eukprot:1157884-Pelagomonas_calceolata.AAC.14
MAKGDVAKAAGSAPRGCITKGWHCLVNPLPTRHMYRLGPARPGAAAAGVCRRLQDLWHGRAAALSDREVHEARAAARCTPEVQGYLLPVADQGEG